MQMPLVYEIDAGKRLVRSRALGVLIGGGLLEHDRALAADSAFDPAFAQLGDLRDVRWFVVDRETMQAAATAHAFSVAARRALVAGTAVTIELCQIVAAYRVVAPPNIRVFRTLEEAGRWLETSSTI